MASSPARATAFLAALVIVLAVLASLYLGKSKPGNPVIPDTTSNDPHSEIRMLEAMWKQHPNHAPIALQLGNLYAAQGEHQKAIRFYREFLKLDTSATGWEVRLDVARSLHATGRPDEAKAELRWILQRDPDHAGALYNMGAIEANSGHYSAAREYWDRLITKHPSDTLALFAAQSLEKLK
jgi:tetratricopeptide (TPR) repeat protein